MTDNRVLTNGIGGPLKVTYSCVWYSRRWEYASIVPVTFFGDTGIQILDTFRAQSKWVSCFFFTILVYCVAGGILGFIQIIWFFAGLDFIEGQGEDFERALESTGELFVKHKLTESAGGYGKQDDCFYSSIPSQSIHEKTFFQIFSSDIYHNVSTGIPTAYKRKKKLKVTFSTSLPSLIDGKQFL